MWPSDVATRQFFQNDRFAREPAQGRVDAMAVRQVVTGQFAQLLVIQRVEVALQQLTIDVRLGITVIRYRGRRHRMA